MTFDFNRKLFFTLSIVFIIMTIIGTITHECGHYLFAKILGYNTRINYGYTILESNLNKSMSQKENFIFTLGGPFRTIFTGTLGVALLYIFRRTFNTIEKLSFFQWILIFT